MTPASSNETERPGLKPAVDLQQDNRRGRQPIDLFIAAVIAMLFVSSAVALGSLTLFSEAVRSVTFFATTLGGMVFAVRRAGTDRYDFGTHKLGRFVDLLSGAAMTTGALVLFAVATRALSPETVSHGPGQLNFAIAAVINMIALMVHAYCWISTKSVRTEKTRRMVADLSTQHLQRTTDAIYLQIVLTIAALVRDPVLAEILDLSGTLIVAVLMLRQGARLMASTLPDLADAPADNRTVDKIRRVAVRTLGSSEISAIRTRSVAEVTHVQVILKPNALLTDQASVKLRATLQRLFHRQNRTLDLVITSHRD